MVSSDFFVVPTVFFRVLFVFVILSHAGWAFVRFSRHRNLPGRTPTIILNETGLRRILKSYFDYYERSRTHLSLGNDAPLQRAIQPPWAGPIVVIPQVGGLHHRYANCSLKRTRFFTRILHSLTLLLYLNTVSERVRTESQYFRAIERTATSPNAHE